MRKIISILIIAAISMGLASCSILDNIKTTDEDRIEASKLKGEELKETVVINEDYAMYTKDNLPEDMIDVDIDSDGLTNAEEIQYGTEMYNMDTDGDGLADGIEVYETKTSPLKWSSRDDEVSDLEYHIVNQNEKFETGWTETNEFNVKVRITEPKDLLFYFSKVSTDVFDELETISEAFRINEFSGVLAVDTSNFNNEVSNSIAVYRNDNGEVTKLDTAINEDRSLEFIVSDGDTLVLVYEPKID